MSLRLVLDWDGTVTETDVLNDVVTTFGDERVYDETEADLGGSLTLNQVIAIELRTVRAELSEVVDWLRANVRVRAGFAELAREHRPLIVSSGFHELIDPVLAREGLELEVVANTLVPRAEGWEAVFRSAAPCRVCGEPCKRSDVAGLGAFAYGGDGFSDRCVAESASRVFARAGLAAYLAQRGVPFEPFEDFYEVADALAPGTSAAWLVS